MTDDSNLQTPPSAPPATPPAGNTPAPPAPPPTEDDGSIGSFPPAAQEVIRQLRTENARHRTEARNQKEAADRAERERLAKQGEWKEAYDKVAAELEPLKKKAERADAVEAFMAKTLKARIDALPEQYRTLVPKYDDPLQTLAWLDQSAPLLVPPKAPSLDPGAQSSGNTAPLTADEQEWARRMNLSDEQFAASKAAMGKG